MSIENLKGRSVRIGPTKITFTHSGLMLVFLPSEDGGWADHLTVALPQGVSDEQHDFAPHLTRRRKGSKKSRQDLSGGAFGVEDLDRWIKVFEREVFTYWLSHTHLADLTLLDMAGYLVAAIRPDDPAMVGMCQGMFRCFEPREGVKVTGLPQIEEDLEQMGRASWDALINSLRSPLDLDEFKSVHQPLQLLRFAEDEHLPMEQIGTLQYLPRGLPAGNWEGGWYLTHSSWMHQKNVSAWLPRIMGPELMGLMSTVMEAFGYEWSVPDQPRPE